MSSPWPAPDADEAVDGRSPNYLLRRVAAAVVAVAVVAGGFVLVKRVMGGDDDSSTSSRGGARSWDTVVLQDSKTRAITVLDRSGDEISTAKTQLLGVTDVGVDGRVVVGLQGDPATDGLAALDLESGELTDLKVHYTTVIPIGTSGVLLSTNGAGSESELIDVASGTTIDLLDQVDTGVDDALVVPSSVRVDEQRTHLAFTEVRSFETYIMSLEDLSAPAVSVAGSIVAIAFERVVTATNRGDSVLLDLSSYDGERLGTVEVPPPAAVMLVDDSSAIVVGRDGTVRRADFGDESVDDVVDLAPVLPTAPGAAEDADLVTNGVAIASNTRLALFGERFVAFVGADGQLIKSIDQAEAMNPRSVDPEDRCLVVFGSDSPPVFIDVEGGSIIGALTDSAVARSSHDGCIVLTVPMNATTKARVIGPDFDEKLDNDQRFLALSDDGTGALVSGKPTIAGPTFVLPLPDGDTIDLGSVAVLSATFAHR